MSEIRAIASAITKKQVRPIPHADSELLLLPPKRSSAFRATRAIRATIAVLNSDRPDAPPAHDAYGDIRGACWPRARRVLCRVRSRRPGPAAGHCFMYSIQPSSAPPARGPSRFGTDRARIPQEQARGWRARGLPLRRENPGVPRPPSWAISGFSVCPTREPARGPSGLLLRLDRLHGGLQASADLRLLLICESRLPGDGGEVKSRAGGARISFETVPLSFGYGAISSRDRRGPSLLRERDSGPEARLRLPAAGISHREGGRAPGGRGHSWAKAPAKRICSVPALEQATASDRMCRCTTTGQHTSRLERLSLRLATRSSGAV